MMRYQRLISPDCLPLNNGRKSSRDGESSGRIPSYSPYIDDKAPRPRPPINRDHPFSYFAAASASSLSEIPPPAVAVAVAVDVAGDVSSICASGGDGLLQWGNRKRSRGSRSESRPACDDSGHSRPVIKIQRRAAAAATVAMPPPGGLYIRASNLRPTTPIRDATAHVSRNVDERSNGHARSERRSPASSPLEKGHHNKAAAAGSQQNGCAMESVTSSDPSKPASDQEITGAQATLAAEKLSLNHFEWPRIYISLSRKEKEDDFLAMKGTKLPQRPKKRAKNVDKTLQYCFPGMWLSDLTRGRYEVREKKCVKKKRRGGLKGLESMDSDSE